MKALRTFCLFYLALISVFILSERFYRIFAASPAAVSPSMTTAQIQTAINAGNGAIFADGNYNLTATLSMPCTNGIVYTGTNVGIVSAPDQRNNLPKNLFSGPNTGSYSMVTKVNGSGTYTSATGGCTFQYLGFTGQHGAIEVPYNSSGVTIKQNYVTLNDGVILGQSGTLAQYSFFFTGDGSDLHCPGSSNSAGPWTCGPAQGVSYVTVDHNVFYNNCLTARAAGTEGGSYCTMIFTQAYSNFMTITNNYIELAEEGIKFGEIFYKVQGTQQNNADVENNRMFGIQRIGYESQQARGGSCVFSHNSAYDEGGRIVPPGFPTFDYSFPCNALDNVAGSGGFVNPCGSSTPNGPPNQAPCNNGGFGYGIQMEFGDNGSPETGTLGNYAHYNYFLNGNFVRNNVNLTCGPGKFCYGGGIDSDENKGNEVITNNFFCGTDTWNGTVNNVGLAIQVDNVNPGTPPPAPTINPNTVVQTCTNQVTASPVLTASASNVTMAAGDVNHPAVSIFYTTDGSTPSIFPEGGSSGSSQLYTGPFTPPTNTTVKAIAQWGQGANQGIVFTTQSTCTNASKCNNSSNGSTPFAEWGLVPSNVVSVVYTGSGGTPTAATPVLSPATETFTTSVLVTASDSTPGAVIHYTADGTTPTATSPTFPSGGLTITATTTVQVLATATGYLTSGIDNEVYTLSAPATPTLLSGSQSNTGSINTLQVGAAGVQQIATGNYSDGVMRTEPDAYGNTPIWTTTNSSVLAITTYVSTSNPGGLWTCLAVGTATIKVSAGGHGFSDWGVTCTAASKTLTSIAISTTNGITSLNTGSTNQLLVVNHYSDGSTDTTNPSSWASTDSTKATVSSSGLVTGVAAGSVSFTATTSSVTSNSLALTIVTTVSLQTITISNVNAITATQLGWTIAWKALCNYSDGTSPDCTSAPDGHGNQAVFASANTALATFTNNILKQIGIGSANVTASAAGVTSSPTMMTYLPLTPVTYTLSGLKITFTGSTITLSYK